MTTGHFGWYELMTHDPEKASEFYGKLFGWDVKEEKMGEDLTYNTIVAGECQLGGFVEDTQSPSDSPAKWVSCVSVKSVDDTVKTAKKQGAKILMGPIDIGEAGRYAVLSDAQGAVFSIHSMKTGGPDMPACALHENVFVWTELATSDSDAAKKFYGKVSGWTFDKFPGGDGQDYWIAKAADGQGIGGIWNIKAGAPNAPPTPMWTPYVSVADPDAIVAKAKSLGARVLMEPQDVPKVGRFGVLADPFGGVIGVIHGDPDNPM